MSFVLSADPIERRPWGRELGYRARVSCQLANAAPPPRYSRAIPQTSEPARGLECRDASSNRHGFKEATRVQFCISSHIFHCRSPCTETTISILTSFRATDKNDSSFASGESLLIDGAPTGGGEWR